jgi:hypothetical protein
VDGVMQGMYPVHAHHGPASLLMLMLAVWGRRGQNGKYGKKRDKSHGIRSFDHICADYRENVSVHISFCRELVYIFVKHS